MSKKRKKQTGFDAINLWQWGLIVIFGGIVSSLLSGFFVAEGSSAEARGQQFGAAAASGLFIVVGVVLIIVGLIRRKK